MLGSVGMKIVFFFFFFFFFWKAIKIAGSAQKTGSVGLAETQLFFRPKHYGFSKYGIWQMHVIWMALVLNYLRCVYFCSHYDTLTS